MLAALPALTVLMAACSSVPGDCWNGALSDDPLHCSVLQQAQRDGIIEVDAIYRAGGALFIYLVQTEPVSDDVYEYIEDRTRGEAARSGGDVSCERWDYGCSPGVMEDNDGYTVMPVSVVYEDITLIRGGAGARRSYPGWPSFVPLWPEDAGGLSATEAAGTSWGDVKFDVSEVDATGIPELKCRDAELLYARHYDDCAWWKKFPDLHLASVIESPDGKLYVQVKAASNGEADVEAVRDVLEEQYIRPDREDYVIIAVKYDFGEMWRWSQVINRFARTSGNVLGITHSVMGRNYHHQYSFGGNAVYPLAHLPEADLRTVAWESELIPDYRTTINLFTLYLDRTVAALPQLLKQLNVPVDTVGVIIEIDRTPDSFATLDVLD